MDEQQLLQDLLNHLKVDDGSIDRDELDPKNISRRIILSNSISESEIPDI